MPYVDCSFGQRESQSYQVRKQISKERVPRGKGRLRKTWLEKVEGEEFKKQKQCMNQAMHMMDTTLFARSEGREGRVNCADLN